MELHQLQPGDMVFAATAITNDGSLPQLAEGAVVAAAGTRGVILNIGHLEEQPSRELFLVRFEQGDGELGPATGCWPEELRVEEAGPVLLRKLRVAGLTFHDLHEDDVTPHPLDGMVLITGGAGEGFRERLARRGIEVHVTAEREPEVAVEKLLTERRHGDH